MTCSCGGKVLTAYIRERRPEKGLVLIPLGKVCIQCRRWQDDPAEGHQVDTTDFAHGTGGMAGPEEPPPLDAQGIADIQEKFNKARSQPWDGDAACTPAERGKKGKA